MITGIVHFLALLPFVVASPAWGEPGELGEAIVKSARLHLKGAHKQPARNCTSLVSSVLDHAGIHWTSNVKGFWDAAPSHGRRHSDSRPLPGDLAVFDRTTDRNDDGQEAGGCEAFLVGNCEAGVNAPGGDAKKGAKVTGVLLLRGGRERFHNLLVGRF